MKFHRKSHSASTIFVTKTYCIFQSNAFVTKNSCVAAPFSSSFNWPSRFSIADIDNMCNWIEPIERREVVACNSEGRIIELCAIVVANNFFLVLDWLQSFTLLSLELTLSLHISVDTTHPISQVGRFWMERFPAIFGRFLHLKLLNYHDQRDSMEQCLLYVSLTFIFSRFEARSCLILASLSCRRSSNYQILEKFKFGTRHKQWFFLKPSPQASKFCTFPPVSFLCVTLSTKQLNFVF